MRLYALYDKVAQVYHRPFTDKTNESMIRGMKQEVNRAAADNPLYLYPKDHAVYHVGEFDEDTGTLTGLAQPALVAEAETLINKPDPANV